MKENITISLPSKPEYVSIARLTSAIIANKMGFDIEAIEDIKVAVGEACNNAVMHGCREYDTYQINFIVKSDRFIVEVKDNGNGFEVDKCPKPDLKNPRENGLGIFIIKSLMDEVEVKSLLGRGTNIKMVRYLCESS